MKKMAEAGDREAQFTLGFMFTIESDGVGGVRVPATTSPQVQVGLVLSNKFPLTYHHSVPQDRGESMWSPDRRDVIYVGLSVPTLGGGGHGASGEGGGARARVRY